jgi:predicted PurR-regulated permease PerM
MNNLITLLNFILSIFLVIISIYVYNKINNLTIYDKNNQTQLFGLVKDLNNNTDKLEEQIINNMDDIDKLEDSTALMESDIAALQTTE